MRISVWTARCLALGLGTVLTALAAPAVAVAETRHALIVAVNAYPGLGDKATLNGPTNDADAMLTYLIGTPALGFTRDHITVLANGPYQDADGIPDRKSIVAALDALAARVVPGDLVYLHFAGHGSQQKARDPASEPDGLDEVFLPSDTGAPKDGVYPNALVDDDIGTELDKIGAAGAFVFAVFDSCNSSSLTRAPAGESSDVKERWLPTPETIARATATADDMREPLLNQGDRATPASGQIGGLVTFFAAQTIEATPEMSLPRRTADAKVFGLFTYAMRDVLAKHPAITYRQLAEGIMNFYAVGNFRRPTPLFEGDLDKQAFGQADIAQVRQWPIEIATDRATLSAGEVHGLTKDTLLAVLADPVAPTGDAIGYMLVSSVSAMNARLAPLSHGGMPALDLEKLPRGAVARPVEIPLSFQLSVEIVELGEKRFANAAGIARRAIEKIAADKSLPVNLRIAAPGETGDLRLVVGSEKSLYPDTATDDTARLWFLPADGRLPLDARLEPHSIGIADAITGERIDQLKANLTAIFRATGLSRLSSVSTPGADESEVDFSIRSAKGGATVPLLSTDSPVVAAGDEILVAIENKSVYPVDIDILLIGPNYAIQHLMGHRFQAGDHLETPLVGISATSFGQRRLVQISRQVKGNAHHSDLSLLEQPGIRSRAGGQGAQDVAGLIDDLIDAPATRAAVAYQRDAPKVAIRFFDVESVP